MIKQRNLILLIILSLFAAFYYLFEIKLAKRKTEKMERERLIFQVRKDKITEVQVIGSKEKVVCQKINGKWIITTPPLNVEAGKYEIDAVLDSVSTYKYKEIIDEQPADLKKYGLDKPKFEISVKAKNEPKIITVLVGEYNPAKNNIYVKRADKPAVLLTEQMFLGLERKAFDFRDLNMLIFNFEDINKLMWEVKGKRIISEKKKEQWWFTAPNQVKANNEKLKILATQIRIQKIQEFVSENVQPQEKSKLAVYGLDNPQATISVWFEKKPADNFTVYLGKTKEKRIYARKEGDTKIVFLPIETLTILPDTTTELEERQITIFEVGEINRIKANYKGMEMYFEERLREWEFIKPKLNLGFTTKINIIMKMLHKIKNLKFKEIAEISASKQLMDKYNLNNPMFQYTLWEKNKKLDAVIISEKEGKYFCKKISEPAIYDLETVLVKELEEYFDKSEESDILREKQEKSGKK